MELRSSTARGKKDVTLRVLLASIGLALYAPPLEEAHIDVKRLARSGDAELKRVTKAPKAARTKMVAAASDYVERQSGRGDARARLEQDIFAGPEDDSGDDFGDFGQLDFAAELEAMKKDALFTSGSPGGNSSLDSSQWSAEGDSSSDSSSDEEMPAPPIRATGKKKPPAKAGGAGRKQSSSNSKADATATPSKSTKGKGGKQAAAKGNGKAQPDKKGSDTPSKPSQKGKGGSGGSSSPAESKTAKQKRSKGGIDGGQPKSKAGTAAAGGGGGGGAASQRKSKGGAVAGAQQSRGAKLSSGPSCCARLARMLVPRSCCSRASLVTTLQLTRTLLSLLFTFYCVNWVIAGGVKWMEYSRPGATVLAPTGFFLPALLYFATPRPPLYPVPAYLLVNAMVDVLEMWINRDGRFAASTPSAIKLIGVSLYACDIGAVLYGGCFLLTAATHALSIATGRPLDEMLIVDEFGLPRPGHGGALSSLARAAGVDGAGLGAWAGVPTMPPLLGYGTVMVGCVCLEQLQVWLESVLSHKGGLRKYLRKHGVHIVLLFILLPIVGTFIAGIAVFVSGLLTDLADSIPAAMQHSGLWGGGADWSAPG